MTSKAEVAKLAMAHDRLVDTLDGTHSQRLQLILDRLESRVVEIASVVPVKAGALADAGVAIKQKPVIESAIRGTFLTWAHNSVDEYDQVAESVIAMMGNSLDGFLADDPQVINQLKRVAFQGYEDIAERYVETLANGLYQSTIAGRPVQLAIKDLQQTVNGVFIKSDDQDIAMLVEFVKANADDPRKASAVADAVNRLHTVYGADRVGNNLRRYAYQQVHDGLMQFSASFVAKKAQDAELTHYQYYGSLVKDSRPFCVENAGRTLSIDEIRDKWAMETWKGKSSGEPLIVRGGFNCRHHFVPVEPDWME